MEKVIMLLLILLPAGIGILLPLLKRFDTELRKSLALMALILEAVLATCLIMFDTAKLTLFSMTETLTVFLHMDGVSKLFFAIAAYGFLLAGIYAFRYLEHSEHKSGFFSFYLLAEAALMGMDLAGNLITMYLFFEMITLLSMPLVLHDRTPEATRAALKYLFYSIAGAFMALCCIFFLSKYCDTLSFKAGGSLNKALAAGHETLLQVVILLGVIGFGAKAGMYPLHGWLPAAHPVAPAPASAVLSGVIAKAGVLAILRLIYFCVGTEFLAGTWVQQVLLGLALLTVFMGSMMAFREKVFKKRLAYSSISQISYALVGLFCMTAQSVTGGLLQVLFHAIIKICLFLVAGSFIYTTGKQQVDEYRGFGRSMPITLWSFTIASLALIGIPPASGFVSKWYLAVGALDSGLPVFSWLAPVILLVSALLTAGYLLPISIRGFFPGKGFKQLAHTDEGGAVLWLPIAVLAALALVLGIFAGPLVHYFSSVAEGMLG